MNKTDAITTFPTNGQYIETDANMNKHKLYCEQCKEFRDYTIFSGDQKLVVGGIEIVANQKIPICNICGCETASNMELFKYNDDQAQNSFKKVSSS